MCLRVQPGAVSRELLLRRSGREWSQADPRGRLSFSLVLHSGEVAFLEDVREKHLAVKTHWLRDGLLGRIVMSVR